MTQNKVMKLWTAIVTAFLALCTTLGLITTTPAAAAVPQARDASQQRGHRDDADDVLTGPDPPVGPCPPQ